MSNVVDLVQDDVVRGLLDVVARVRSGDLVGVTVVTTDHNGVVTMNVLSVPIPGRQISAA